MPGDAIAVGKQVGLCVDHLGRAINGGGLAAYCNPRRYHFSRYRGERVAEYRVWHAVMMIPTLN